MCVWGRMFVTKRGSGQGGGGVIWGGGGGVSAGEGRGWVEAGLFVWGMRGLYVGGDGLHACGADLLRSPEKTYLMAQASLAALRVRVCLAVKVPCPPFGPRNNAATVIQRGFSVSGHSSSHCTAALVLVVC